MALPMDTCGDTLPPGTHGPGGRDNAFTSTCGAAQEAPDIGQWEGQDVPLVRPSSSNVKGGIPSCRRYLPTLPLPDQLWWNFSPIPLFFATCAPNISKLVAFTPFLRRAQCDRRGAPWGKRRSDRGRDSA